DTRPAAAYAAGHVPGTLSIPMGRTFNTWAGWFLPYDRDFYLIVDDSVGAASLDEAVRDLAMIGLDRVAGYFDASAIEAWARAGRALAAVERITPAEVERRHAAGEVAVIDVRGNTEWEAGHIPGVANIPAGYL